MKNISQRRFLFHPLTVLGTALIATLIFALFINLFFKGGPRWFYLYYFAPIGIPFVAFLFERAEHKALASKAGWGIDALIVGLALVRSVILIPIISGHALFLTYAILTSQSKITRITAILVLLEVAYLKIFMWSDATIIGGVVVGSIAAILYGRMGLSDPVARASARSS
jgi:hypothetical protein